MLNRLRRTELMHPSFRTKEAYTCGTMPTSGNVKSPQRSSLCCFLVLDLEVSELVGVLLSGNDSEELLEVLLLKVLLGQVLKVSLGEWDLGLDDNLVLVHGDGNGVSEVVGLVVNLDLLGEELLEILKDDNVILNWESAVDEELGGSLLG